MDIKFLVFVLIGEIFIYLGMKFPPFSESKIDFVKRLWTCSECCGVWVFTFLSFVMGECLFRELFYIPFISELATGCVVAFICHLIELGWKSKFEVLVIG